MEQGKYLQQMVLGKLVNHMEKNYLTPISILCTKVNSKWIKDLDIGLEPINYSEGKTCRTLYDRSLQSPIALVKQTETEVNKWNNFKLKSFCNAKENRINSKVNPQTRRKCLPVISLTRVNFEDI